MTTRRQLKDNMKNFRVPSLVTLLIAATALLTGNGARAAVVDLVHGDSGSLSNSYGTAIFEFTQPQPTGTGVIKPFLRVQADPAENFGVIAIDPAVVSVTIK